MDDENHEDDGPDWRHQRHAGSADSCRSLGSRCLDCRYMTIASLADCQCVIMNKGKGKSLVLAIALLTRVRLATRSALQSRKWQLIGMS